MFVISNGNVGAIVELRDVDLNLFVVFRHMLATGKVSETAKALGLTQPAVSNALARLRRALDDELFVRTSQGMAPTPLAKQLADPVSVALEALYGALNRDTGFDPASSRQNFTIAMSDIGEIYFLPDLMEALAVEAPGVTISTIRNTAVDLRHELEAGHVDLAVGLLPDLQAGFYQRHLFHQRYVGLFRRGHALDRPDLTVEDYMDADHVQVSSPDTGHGRIDHMLERHGVRRRIQLRVPHFVAVGHILHTTNLVATVPETLARRSVEPFGLVWRPLPVPLPEIDIGMFWHALYHRDDASRWLRDLLFRRFADAAAGVIPV